MNYLPIAPAGLRVPPSPLVAVTVLSSPASSSSPPAATVALSGSRLYYTAKRPDKPVTISSLR